MESYYVLESLNHLVFGQLQSTILNGPLMAASRAKSMHDSPET